MYNLNTSATDIPKESIEDITIGCALVAKDGKSVSYNGWKLPAGQTAAVVNIDERGSIKLRNPEGNTSAWSPASHWATQPTQRRIGAGSVGRFSLPCLDWTPQLRSSLQRELEVELPCRLIGKFIGPGGAAINAFKARAHLDSVRFSDDRCILKGGLVAVCQAVENLKTFIAKEYLPILYQDCVEVQMKVPPRDVSEIIGRRGVVINALKANFDVDLIIRDDCLYIAGSRRSVYACKHAVHSILKYRHHEVTHPGVFHVALDVERQDYGTLIGKKGSELRHIQNAYRVQVYIPRCHGRDVLVLGDANQIKHAAAYVNKMLLRAREKREDDDDLETEEVVNAAGRRVFHALKTHASDSKKGLAQRCGQHEHQNKGSQKQHARAHHAQQRTKGETSSDKENNYARERELQDASKRKQQEVARGRARDAKYRC